MLLSLIYGLQNLQIQDLGANFQNSSFSTQTRAGAFTLLNMQTFWQWQCHSWRLTRPKRMKEGWWLQIRCSKGRYSVIDGQCQPGEGVCLCTVTLHALVLVYCKITTLSFGAKHFVHPPSFQPFTQQIWC